MSYDSVVALLNPAMSAIYCASLLVLWQHQRHLTYIAIFALSYAVRGLCFGTLYFAFIQEAPALRTAANSLVLLAMILLSVALSRRYDQRPRYGLLFTIGAVSLAALYFYQFVEPSLLVRAVVLNWALAAVCLVMLVDILQRPYRNAVEQLFFGLVVLACIGFLLRPLTFQIPGVAADQIEAAYWLVVSITDALICSTLGVAIFAIIAVDVTAGFKAEAQIDALSGLYNRRGFDLRGRDVLARQVPGTSVTAILADLDHFKSINDRFGHNNGDRIIQKFARILKENAPDDAIIARQGGEEFAVLLPSGHGAAAYRLAEAVRSAFKERALNVLSDDCSPTASFGIAVAGQGDDLSALISRADRALYQAKSEGRDCVRAVESSLT
jgi:diguanylate cyclase (GGDEF)-like protein